MHQDVLSYAVGWPARLCGLVRPVSEDVEAAFSETPDSVRRLDDIQLLRGFNG